MTAKSTRERLPTTRIGLVHKCVLHAIRPSGKMGKYNIYIRTGNYKSGRLGELFFTINVSGEESDTKEGKTADLLYYATLRGTHNQWAIAVSRDLQHGDSLDKIASKFSYQDYPPQGITENPDIPTCKSIIDYTVRWLAMAYAPSAVTPVTVTEPEIAVEELAKDLHLSRPIAEE
jgi:ribonucleoside-diphosphate reductase alpha chain